MPLHTVFIPVISFCNRNGSRNSTLYCKPLETNTVRRASEEAAVFDLASLHWKKRRFEAGSRQALQKQLDYSAAADTTNDAWDLLADAARAAAKSHSEAAQVVCQQIWKYAARVFKPDDATADSQSIEFEKLTVLAKELNIVSKDLVIPLLHAAEKQKLDQIERAYHPDTMERELKIQADFGRQIEKAMKRLVLLKECKKYYCVKPVNSNGIGPGRLTAT